jgi:hypothetical protein
MTTLTSLWLPVLLSAVFVFVASSIIHMATPWHNTDMARLPDEDKVLDALRPFGLPPGDYMAPRPGSTKDLKSPEFSAKMQAGPVLTLTVQPPGPFSMGRSLLQWFLYCVAIGIFAAYIAGRALPPGAHYLQVFRFAGATAFLGYSAALWQMSIWYRRSWLTTTKSTIDGLIFGLLTGGTFGWLWPH